MNKNFKTRHSIVSRNQELGIRNLEPVVRNYSNHNKQRYQALATKNLKLETIETIETKI